jgi:hypothetical protein
MAENSYRKELGFAAVVTLICSGLTIRSFSYAADSSQFPRFLTVVMTCLSLFLLVRTLKSRPQGQEKGKSNEVECAFWSELKVPFLVFLLTALYAVSIQVVGYFTSTIVFLVGSMMFFGKHRLWVMLFSSGIFLAVVYALFVHFLGLRLPEGLLF